MTTCVHRVLLQAQGDPHPLAVGLVADIADALDLLVADQLGDFFDEPGLVDLVRQLRDDDGFRLAALVRFDHHPRPDPDDPAAGAVGFGDAAGAVNDPARGKIGAGNVGHQLLAGHLRVVDEELQGIDHLGEVVRRYVGRHADGDAGRAVDQQVRDLRGQHLGLGQGLVVVGDEIDRLLVQVDQHFVGQALHADLGVPHGGGGVAVDGAEVALAVDQRVAHGEVLGHAHDGVVHGGIAVRVIFTDHVADDAGRLLVGLVPVVLELAHGEEHAPMDRLQPVAHIRQRPADDDAHGVVEIGLLHLFFDADFGRFFHMDGLCSCRS